MFSIADGFGVSVLGSGDVDVDVDVVGEVEGVLGGRCGGGDGVAGSKKSCGTSVTGKGTSDGSDGDAELSPLVSPIFVIRSLTVLRAPSSDG